MNPRRSLLAILCVAVATLATPALGSHAAAQGSVMSGTVPAADSAAAARPQRPDRNLITEAEIDASTTTHRDLYEAVRALRPRWLRERGPESVSRGAVVRIYLDGMRIGGPTELRNVDPQRVKRIEYLDSSAATTQFGSDHSRGAILIFTR